jgi:hypothetical protein
MGVTLEITLKDKSKNSIKATIQEADTAGALAVYNELLERFPSAPSPAPAAGRGKKSATDETQDSQGQESQTGEAAPPAEKVVDINQNQNRSTAKRLFAQEAITLNELAVLWAKRMAICITQFNGKPPTDIVEQLNFRKPLVTMDVQELRAVIDMIRTTLTSYGANNPGVAAYLKVVGVIDGLAIGDDPEWQKARQPITAQDWSLLGADGNAHLLDAAKAYLVEKQTVLQAAAAASA